MSEPYLTKRQVAAHLQVSVSTVERLRLPHLRVGGQNRYRLSEVEAFLRGASAEDANVLPLPTRGAA